jgi:hypothetical protein
MKTAQLAFFIVLAAHVATSLFKYGTSKSYKLRLCGVHECNFFNKDIAVVLHESEKTWVKRGNLEPNSQGPPVTSSQKKQMG